MRVLSVHKKTWNAKLRSEFKFEFESNNMKQNRKQKEWKKWKQHLGHLYTLSVQTPNHTHPMCPISCLHSCRPSWVPGAARELTGRWRWEPLAGFVSSASGRWGPLVGLTTASLCQARLLHESVSTDVVFAVVSMKSGAPTTTSVYLGRDEILPSV